MLALDREVPLRNPVGEPRDGSAWREVDVRVAELFARLYRGSPLRPGEVGLVRTGTSLFFTCPLPGTPSHARALASRDGAARAEFERFAREFGEVRQRDYQNFPVFGFFRGEYVDPSLLDALASASGIPREEVERVLTTMVSVLPADELDQYVVHDAWGHQWQGGPVLLRGRLRGGGRLRGPAGPRRSPRVPPARTATVRCPRSSPPWTKR